jgi:outer membrane cobalamin receptor
MKSKRFNSIAGWLLLVGPMITLVAGCAGAHTGGGVDSARRAPKHPAVLTGSLIPRPAGKDPFRESSSAVSVIDQTDIERSGAATVSEALRKRVPH